MAIGHYILLITYKELVWKNTTRFTIEVIPANNSASWQSFTRYCKTIRKYYF